MGSRRHLNIRGKSANLPAITERDWKDIEFGVKMDVDYYALSFVRDAECIYELQEYLRSKGSTAKVRICAIDIIKCMLTSQCAHCTASEDTREFSEVIFSCRFWPRLSLQML